MRIWLVLNRLPITRLKINVNLIVMSDPKNSNQISIELNEEVAQGTYSNLAVITHSASEFVIDFVRIMPGIPKAQVKSRIILTPEHAKRLVAALEDNIDKYEAVHGTIKNVSGSGPVMPLNFGGPTAQA
jgi:hypothetical protein